SDHRLGQVLDMLERGGWLDSTLFVFTSDHGMAAQDVSLAAHPARHPERIGLKGGHGRPANWARDPDGQGGAAPRSPPARVLVRGNDADPWGEKPAIAGADVLVHAGGGRAVASLTTNDAGIAGFATPADLPPSEIALVVRHAEFNPRHLRLDGTNLAIDLRRELYGRDR